MSPSIAFSRAKKRASSGDSNLKLEYFHKLYDAHEKMMKSEEVPILKLDARKDPDTLAREAAAWIKGQIK